MRKLITILLALTLIASPSFQAMPALAADPTELDLTIEDLLGAWTGKLEILLDQDTGHFAALADRSSGPYDVEVRLNNKYMTDPEADLRLGYAVYSPYTIESIYLEEDGSFYGLSQSSPSRSLELLGAFEVEGTRIKLNGTIKEKVWDMPGAGPDEGTRTLSLIAYKAGAPVTAPSKTTDESLEFGTGTAKGRISSIEGKAYIQRDARIIPAVVGEVLLAGDTVVSESGVVTIEGEVSGSLKIPVGIRLQIPEEKAVKKTSSSALAEMLGNIWSKTKEFLSGESFEVKTPNGACGVRG